MIYSTNTVDKTSLSTQNKFLIVSNLISELWELKTSMNWGIRKFFMTFHLEQKQSEFFQFYLKL